MFFDMTTMQQFDQIRAIENAEKFVKEQMTSSDLIQIMNYSTKLNVLQEFTDDRELLLSTIKNMVVGAGAELAGAAAGAAEGDDTGGFTQDDTEFNIFNTDRQLSAITDAVTLLSAYPREEGDDLLLQRHSEELESTIRASFVPRRRRRPARMFPIYSGGRASLVASAPGGDATRASPRGTEPS